MFETSHPFGLFDYLRVPYTVDPEHDGHDGLGRVFLTGRRDRVLLWPLAGETGATKGRRGRYVLDGRPLFGHVVCDGDAARLVPHWDRDWTRAEDVTGSDGVRASVRATANGDVWLPFDPAEVMHEYWSEGYRHAGTPGIRQRLRPALVRLYYAVRPLLPRPVQLAMRRTFTKVQGREEFPDWPVESALHDLYDRLLALLAAFTGEPVPWIAPWPHGRSWAFVLTHDVETDAGCAAIPLLRDEERAAGVVSSWNFVPLRYRTPDAILDGLRAEGCEIGVHGLLHDGRDLESPRMLRKRLPGMRAHADRWGAVGFRSPATQRGWAMMPTTGFDYDSSYHDSAPYEPQPGGSCTYLPYFIDELVELPMTLPMDHTVFTILDRPDGRIWLDKAAYVRDHGGMVLVLTHPDYAVDPRVVDAYRALLDAHARDDTAWHALPKDVAAWWRRRAASTIERAASGWTVTGPAAGEARVRLAGADAVSAPDDMHVA